VVGNNVIMANAASLGGHVHLDDWAILGGFAIVHQFCHIGAHSFAAMGSGIGKDVPPYVLVSGNPAKPHGINVEGLRRRQFSSEQIACIKRAYKTLYQSGILLSDAIAQIRADAPERPEIEGFVHFLQGSERSIVR
jgi:UDP-N-acetylglucosamine acyltransferase